MISASPNRKHLYLLFPSVLWLTVFFICPLFVVGVYSVSTRGTYGAVELGFGAQNFLRALDPLYLGIIGRSLLLALITSSGCLLIGFPMAYVMARSPRAIRNLLMIGVMLPFWTNLLVRAYAVKSLISPLGPLNQLLMHLGWASGTGLENSSAAVAYGMITNYLPLMVLPLYVALEKFDFTLIDAAKDLGASAGQAFWRVLVPGISKGIKTGLVLVGVPALGEFVIPDLFGGAKTMLIGNLISEQFLKTRDWPFGSALAILLILPVASAFFLRGIWMQRKRILPTTQEGISL